MESFEDKLKRLKIHFSYEDNADDTRIEPVSFLSKVYKALKEKYLGKIEAEWDDNYYEYQYYDTCAKFNKDGIRFQIRVTATRCAFLPNLGKEKIFTITIRKSNINAMVERVSNYIDTLLVSYEAYQETKKKLAYYGNLVEIAIGKYSTDKRFCEELSWSEFYYWFREKIRNGKYNKENILYTINILFNYVGITNWGKESNIVFHPKVIGIFGKNDRLIYTFGLTSEGGYDTTWISTVDYNNFDIGFKMTKNTMETINNSHNELVIIRGVPGSGKSTKAQDFVKLGYSHYEADMYFLDENGNYNWDGSKIGKAHSFCYNNVKKDLLAGKNVVVANTFVKESEFQPYMTLCETLHIPFRVIRMTNHFKNVHNVPQNIVDAKERQFQDYEGEELVGANAISN